MTHKIPCPRCREHGGDTAGDNMQVYKDGGYCHACSHRMSKKELDSYLSGVPMQAEQPRQIDAAAELELIKTYPYGAPHRNFPPDICQKLGVRYSVDDQGQADAVYYPYYENGEIVDYKKRIFPKTIFNITGKINRAGMFGQQAIPTERRGLLIITEGEDDKVAADAMFQQLGKGYSVVSLKNGADENGKIDKGTLRDIEFITGFKKVALCFDMDGPGQATANGLAELIAPSTEVRLMKLPEGFKDATDMYRAGQVQQFMLCLNEAQRFTPEGVMEGPDIDIRELVEPCIPGLELPYPKLQQKLKGLRKGEITLLCAGTGIGKTTLAREISHYLASEHEQTIGNVFLEEQWKKTAQGYIAIDNNVPLPLLRVNPKILSKEQWQASYEKFYKSGKTHFFKHFGSVASDRLINKMRYFTLALGCDYIFLDHITMVLSGNDSHDERKDIDVLMTRLAELVTETGVGVVGVVHLKRASGDTSFNEGGEVSLTDLRGSSQLEALSWNVIALERDQQSNTQADVSTIRLLKNREWGYTGICDKMVYSHQTGRLKAISSDL